MLRQLLLYNNCKQCNRFRSKKETLFCQIYLINLVLAKSRFLSLLVLWLSLSLFPVITEKLFWTLNANKYFNGKSFKIGHAYSYPSGLVIIQAKWLLAYWILWFSNLVQGRLGKSKVGM